MKGYKVFNSDWTCRGFQYEVGKTYEIDEKPIICVQGFHFCKELIDCFFYYPFDGIRTKIAEVEAFGDIEENSSDRTSKCCTNKIRIIREIPFDNLDYETNYNEITYDDDIESYTIPYASCVHMIHDTFCPVLGGVGYILNRTIDYELLSLSNRDDSYLVHSNLYQKYYYTIGYNRIFNLKEKK